MSRDSRDERFSDGSFVDWTKPAEFEFVDEVDALNALQELGADLVAARKQVEHVTRYLKAACVAAYAQADVSPQAIIRESGLARQTVYDVLPITSGQ